MFYPTALAEAYQLKGSPPVPRVFGESNKRIFKQMGLPVPPYASTLPGSGSYIGSGNSAAVSDPPSAPATITPDDHYNTEDLQGFVYDFMDRENSAAEKIYERQYKDQLALMETVLSRNEAMQQASIEASRNAAAEANQYSSMEADKQRRWSEMMANSQYQRTVKDMLAAGLNPALLYKGFNASPLPQASNPTGIAADVAAPGYMGVLRPPSYPVRLGQFVDVFKAMLSSSTSISIADRNRMANIAGKLLGAIVSLL